MASLGFGISATLSVYILCFLLLSPPHLSLPTDIHDLLTLYGLPRGMIPDNAESYTVSPSGAFTVKLSSPCYVQYERLVYFDTEIKGQISYGVVSDLSGVHAKELFVWIPVSGIEVKNGGEVEFHVGVFSETFPVKSFEDVPVCLGKTPGLRTKLGLDSII